MQILSFLCTKIYILLLPFVKDLANQDNYIFFTYGVP